MSMYENNCSSASRIYNVTAFGAKGDGLQYDTYAIQNAIDECSKNGGGTICFPNGVYLTGTIFLRDNVELYLAPNVIILGSKDISDYNTGESSPLTPGINWESILFAKDIRNIRISGSGIIDGQGENFECGAEAFSMDDSERRENDKPMVRPSLVYFKNCKDVYISGVKLQGAAQFATLFENCDEMRFDSVTIHNRRNQNTDGLHFFDCNDIFISNCKFDCGDDAIVLNRSAEKVVITNCNISSRWSGIRLGPFSKGNIRNVTVSNCIIHDTYGCAIKLQMGEGGIMENLLFENIIMDNVTGPISIRLSHFSGWQERQEAMLPPGVLRNISFNHIFARVVENAQPASHEVQPFPGEMRSCINITGIPGSLVEGITLSNMHIVYSGGATLEEAKQSDIPEMDYRYPEYYIFGTLPAYALYVRHVKGLVLENVKFEVEKADLRCAILCDDVEDMELSHIKAMGSMQAEALIKLKNSRNVFIHGCKPLNRVKVFLKLEGSDFSMIKYCANNLLSADKPIECESKTILDILED